MFTYRTIETNLVSVVRWSFKIYTLRVIILFASIDRRYLPKGTSTFCLTILSLFKWYVSMNMKSYGLIKAYLDLELPI